MLKSWVIYILSLLGAIAFFFFYKMWLSWFILMVLVFILPVAFLTSGLCSMFIHIEADAWRHVMKGEETQISFTSRGLDVFPFALYSIRIDLLESMTGEIAPIRIVSMGNTTDTVILQTKHCGTYRFSEAKVRVYDMFGLIFIPKKVELSGEVVVLPTPVIPAAMPEMSGFKAKGLRKSMIPNAEIYDIREYVPGDPVKRIHWKLSAKKNIYMIKESQEETYGHSRLYLPLTKDREELDRHLGELLFTSNYFLKHDVEHRIRVLPPLKKEVAFDVATKEDLDHALTAILRMPIPEEGLEDEE